MAKESNFSSSCSKKQILVKLITKLNSEIASSQQGTINVVSDDLFVDKLCTDDKSQRESGTYALFNIQKVKERQNLVVSMLNRILNDAPFEVCNIVEVFSLVKVQREGEVKKYFFLDGIGGYNLEDILVVNTATPIFQAMQGFREGRVIEVSLKESEFEIEILQIC